MSRHFGGSTPQRKIDRTRIIVACGAFTLCLCSGLLLLLTYTSSSKASSSTVVIEKESQIAMEDVLVPVKAIEAGALLDATMFRKETRPKIGLSPRSVKSFEEIKGHYARSMIAPDSPLSGDYLTQVRPNSAITASIPEGYRAVTIRVDATSSVEGWARAGASVDLVWTSNVRGKQAVTIIVQNAKILSAERQVDPNTAPGAPVPSTVTLLVTAPDAAKVQLATSAGSLSLNLRGDNDIGKGQATGSITLDDLYGTQEAKSPEKREGSVRIRKSDGSYDELVLQDGKLAPAQGGEGK